GSASAWSRNCTSAKAAIHHMTSRKRSDSIPDDLVFNVLPTLNSAIPQTRKSARLDLAERMECGELARGFAHEQKRGRAVRIPSASRDDRGERRGVVNVNAFEHLRSVGS